MHSDPLDKWNRRWREQRDDALVADPWLIEVIDLLPVGRVLDLACGRGRNALELARRGYNVTAVDQSDEALAQLATMAENESLPIDCLCSDLETQPPTLNQDYDTSLCFFYLHRPLLSWLLASVKFGGVVVIRTFSSAGSFPTGDLNPQFVLEPGELLTIFSGWEILRHEEGLEPSRKGGSLASIVARKSLQ